MVYKHCISREYSRVVALPFSSADFNDKRDTEPDTRRSSTGILIALLRLYLRLYYKFFFYYYYLLTE